MIKKLSSIKKFGSFEDFTWPATLNEMKQFNLFYGWNYSGKTTISRSLRCFELSRMHGDFPDAQSKIDTMDGGAFTLSAMGGCPHVRVFNVDFVNENLAFDSGRAEAILMLGAEDIAKQEELALKRTQLQEAQTQRQKDTDKRKGILDALDKAMTDYARDHIKNSLSKPNYDKRSFEPKVKQVQANPAEHLATDETLASFISIYRSANKKPLIDTVSAPSGLDDLVQRATTLLGKVVSASKPITRLQSDTKLEAWVNQGRTLHEQKNTCQFCESPLPKDLLDDLSEHFSAEYDQLMQDLKTLISDLQKVHSESFTYPSAAEFYDDFSEDIGDLRRKVSAALGARRKFIDKLVEALNEKQTKAFSLAPCPAFEDTTPSLIEQIKEFNSTIQKHNERTNQFDKERERAFSAIESHFAAKFVVDQKYVQQLAHCKDLQSKIEDRGNEVRLLDGEIRQLELDLSEAVRGAERVNELLASCFGKHDLQLKVTADNKFQLFRNDKPARNLSEGERTAIAFSYFITRVQNRSVPIEDLVVVIDDPISSLDANHLFNTYALIKTELSSVKQMLILTHNFEFFSLIKEWVGDDNGGKLGDKEQSGWKNWSMYLVSRKDSGFSTIETIPVEYVKFKSEYHYLFSTLYHFVNAPTVDFDRLLSLPNMARRFMEAFGGIMIPKSVGLKQKMERLFPDPLERERVWKFINNFSHNTTVTRSLTIPDASECSSIVKSCLEAVEKWNATYFQDLVAEIT